MKEKPDLKEDTNLSYNRYNDEEFIAWYNALPEEDKRKYWEEEQADRQLCAESAL